MGYLNEDGLARYDGLIKNWTTFKSGTVDGVDPLLNWQKTEAAASVAFYPLPAAPLDPVVNFLFTETGPAEGTKGPDNPSTITGVSSITVTRCETVGVDSTDYTIDLGGTYYGGFVDLSTGVMTVTWDSFTFDGTEVWQSSGGYLLQNTAGFYINKADQQAIGFDCYSGEINPVACEVFSTVNSFTIDSQSIYKSLASFMIRVNNSRLSSYGYTPGTSTSAEAVSAFKSWLSDNNVTVFYRRETPYTVQLTPIQIYSLSQSDPYTPRINTVYSDQQSVQVGYPKSPLATATELTNAIISLGGNV